MIERSIKKNLIGVEDIQFGEGSQNQTRAGGSYTITDIRGFWPVNSIEELQALETNLHPKAALVSGLTCTFYQYTGGEWVILQVANSDEFAEVENYIPLAAGKVWNDTEGGTHTLFTFKVATDSHLRQVTIDPVSISHGLRDFTIRLYRRIGTGGSYSIVDSHLVRGETTEYNIHSRLLYSSVPAGSDVYFYVALIPNGTSGACLVDPQRVKVQVSEVSNVVVGA